MSDLSSAILDSLNKNRGKQKHTSPSSDIYPDVFLWDACFIAILRARHGDILGSIQELNTVLEGQNQKTGFIPNMRFVTGKKWWDPERHTFTKPEFGSDYTQPPLLALAAWEIHHALKSSEGLEKATKFLEELFPKLSEFYEYFINFRENGKESSLVGNIHPHETGMDKNPANDFRKWRLKTNGPKTAKQIAVINAGLDYVSTLFLINLRLQAVGWDPQKARNIFWLNDVMFNSVYADNLFVMANIADAIRKNAEAKKFRLKAKEVGKEIVETMWDNNLGLFISKNMGKVIDNPDAITISNLFPIILPEIQDDQLRSMLKLMKDPKWFGTEYPFPSVPVYSRSYDPDYREPGGIWRGPVWVNMNWLLVERGLLRQAVWKKKSNPKLAKESFNLALQVAKKSGEMVQNGLGEFHHPHTGRSLRLENFAWANLGYDLALTAERL